MSQVITGLYGIPISAASAGYAPTNSADVTALIDTEVSGKLDASASSSFITSTADCMPLSASSNYATTGDLANKLDASASSSFQPVGNYVSSDDLSAYQTVDGMSAYQPSGSYQTAGDYVSSSELANYQTTAAMSAYATTGDLANKLDASASSSFITSTADCMPLSASSNYATTGDLANKLDVTSIADYMPLSYSAEFYPTGNPDGYLTSVDLTPYAESSSLTAYQQTAGMSAYLPTSSIQSDSAGITSIGGTAVGGKDYTSPSGTIIVSGSTLEGTDSACVGTLFTGYSGDFGTASIGPSSNYGFVTFAPIPNTVATRLNLEFGYGGESVIYLSSESLGTIEIPKGNDPITTSEMLSGDTSVTVWATEWLSCSASYTADSSDTRRIVELAHETALSSYQPTAGMSAYLPTSAIGVDTASSLITGINGSALSAGSTYSAGQYVQISGDEISVTGLQPSGSYASSTDLSAYQPTADMSAYATTGDLSAKLDASASSSFLTAQEQASWSETASASPSYIVDKPDLVDIVAGPGIVVDNPDGNTLRISTEADAETVLWSGTGTSGATINLSETVKNFDRVRFYGHENNRGRGCLYEINPSISYDANTLQFAISTTDAAYAGAAWCVGQYLTYLTYTDTAATAMTINGGEQWFSFNNTSTIQHNTARYVIIDKVVGIHRIANN